MNTAQTHPWDLTPTEAVALQKELSHAVTLKPLTAKVELIAACDVSFNRFSDIVFAGIVLLEFPSLRTVSRHGLKSTARFPYRTGLLSFREIPPLLEAWEEVRMKPDVIILDGQGYAHPRRLGVASHFGLVTGIPTIGCAKTVLVGKYEEPPVEAGGSSDLIHRGEIVGKALRTKKGTKPVFVSPGHLTDVSTAVALVEKCLLHTNAGKVRYRIPEPTRQAHIFVNELRRAAVTD